MALYRKFLILKSQSISITHKDNERAERVSVSVIHKFNTSGKVQDKASSWHKCDEKKTWIASSYAGKQLIVLMMMILILIYLVRVYHQVDKYTNNYDVYERNG